MFTEDLSKYRMADRMREAEAYRLARELRPAQRRSRVRRLAHGALVTILWPVKR